MNRIKEIQLLHNKGFVILRAQRSTNAPIGWKHKTQDGKDKWGYVEEMQDPQLKRYKETFDATIASKSHLGFYLGHNNLCCIDLDVKKTKVEVKSIVENIIDKFKNKVCIETTKSNGFHIYFRFKTDLPNNPDFTVSRTDNWIEVYYRQRFIACYLSNSKKYNLIHGSISELPELTSKEHIDLLKYFNKWKGVRPKPKKSKPVKIDSDTLKRVQNYVEQIESKGLDITGDNPRWFRIGKAFASAFGIDGFDLFNRISRFSPLYNADTIRDDYQGFVDGDKRERGTKITIATFFHLCEEQGLITLEAMQALRLSPQVSYKEFSIELSKKEKTGEHSHKVVHNFMRAVPICCLDNNNYFVFEHTHWKRKNIREVLDLIKEFIDRSDVDPEFLVRLKSAPYMEMYLKELQFNCLRDSINPNTGDLHSDIYINMENGVLRINMKTGKRDLLDHSPDYNFTTVLPYGYDPLERCPKFDRWINTQIPNKDMHTAYYSFIASCLTKHKADIMLMLAGPTSTGKSSLIDITRRIIGIENSVPISSATLFSDRSESAAMAMQMENKLLAYDFDAQAFKSLEMLLKVAAQEPIMGWQMHVARRPISNYARVIVAMNPQNYSVFNDAVARRFITINMDVKVEKDNTVIPDIYENELAGIFNYVLNIGVKHLIENKGQIKQTKEMREVTVQFHTKEKDAVRWFNSLYDRIDFDSLPKNNRGTLESKIISKYGRKPVLLNMSEMYKAHRAWLEDVEGYSEHKLPIRKYFVADLKSAGIEEQVINIKGSIMRGVYLLNKVDKNEKI